MFLIFLLFIVICIQDPLVHGLSRTSLCDMRDKKVEKSGNKEATGMEEVGTSLVS